MLIVARLRASRWRRRASRRAVINWERERAKVMSKQSAWSLAVPPPHTKVVVDVAGLRAACRRSSGVAMIELAADDWQKQVFSMDLQHNHANVVRFLVNIHDTNKSFHR